MYLSCQEKELKGKNLLMTCLFVSRFGKECQGEKKQPRSPEKESLYFGKRRNQRRTQEVDKPTPSKRKRSRQNQGMTQSDSSLDMRLPLSFGYAVDRQEEVVCRPPLIN